MHWLTYESGVGPYSLALGLEIKRHVSSITFGGRRVEDDAMELFLGSFAGTPKVDIFKTYLVIKKYCSYRYIDIFQKISHGLFVIFKLIGNDI